MVVGVPLVVALVTWVAVADPLRCVPGGIDVDYPPYLDTFLQRPGAVVAVVCAVVFIIGLVIHSLVGSRIVKSLTLRVDRRRALVMVVGVPLVVIVLVTWVAFDAHLQCVRDVIFVHPSYLSTLLQVVPATVVAVFVFAAGTVFVIAQVIHSPLGSRSVELVMRSGRVRLVLLVGVMLLMASLVLVMLAPETNDKNVPDDFRRGVAAAGTALAVMTIVYAPVAIWMVKQVLETFVWPEKYTKRVAERALSSSDSLYGQLRALRQWLRIACGSGESRDITFALRGLQDLTTAERSHIVAAGGVGAATSQDKGNRGLKGRPCRAAMPRWSALEP
jgi:hypothetical protein